MSNFDKKDKTKNTPYTSWYFQFKWISIAFGVIIALILSFPLILTNKYLSEWIDISFRETGQIGDTIGGITGPFIAIIAAALTFLAFWVQFKANEQQKIDLKIERFESKFYEMLRLHRENVEEMNIGPHSSGRKVFVRMYYELRQINLVAIACTMYPKKIGLKDTDLLEIDTMNLVYNIFFHGIGKNSEKQYTKSLNSQEILLLNAMRKILDHIKGHYPDSKLNDIILDLRETNQRHFEDISFTLDIELFYTPFDGHANRLGHYYRHLHHTANFIIKQDFLDEDEKQDYINILRSQMSSFEQLMLYYNAISWFPDVWKELFTKYSLIKNIPIELADFGDKPLEIYADEIKAQAALGKDVFENHKKKSKSN